MLQQVLRYEITIIASCEAKSVFARYVEGHGCLNWTLSRMYCRQGSCVCLELTVIEGEVLHLCKPHGNMSRRDLYDSMTRDLFG